MFSKKGEKSPIPLRPLTKEELEVIREDLEASLPEFHEEIRKLEEETRRSRRPPPNLFIGIVGS